MKKSLLLFGLLAFSLITLFAQSGKYIEFNGIDQYMKIGNHADFNITTTESYTISLQVNVPEFRNINSRFITKRLQNSTLTDKSGYELWGANSASQYYAINSPNAAGNHNNSLSIWPTYTGSTSKWTHIAFVVDRSGGKMYQYIDGVEVANSGTKDIAPWAVNNPFDVYVGCGITGLTTATPTQFFKGQMDNIRIWKKALSKAEIQADMTSTVTSSTEGLVAAYDFENISGAVVSDIKGNHPGTLYNFPVPGNVMISGATVGQNVNFSGKGNDNEDILKLSLNTVGSDAANIQNLVMNMSGTTDINDIESIKIYTSKNVNKFDSRNPDATAALLGTAAPAAGSITVNTNGQLVSGTNYIWVTCKVKDTALEGNKLDASVISLTTNFETYTFASGNPAGDRTILLKRILVFSPGDYNSTNYRIPAITTAADGSLVLLNDKRKNNSADLPQDIDVVSRRSTDGGKTWSDPVTVALGTGYGKGYGDAVVMTAKSGKLVGLFVGGPGFFSSTPSNPMRTYMVTSTDNGVTWTAPKDITSSIYGSGCTDPVRTNWYGSFCGSGHGLSTRAGRLMVVNCIRETSSNAVNNYAMYSDDEGMTWNMSNLALTGGDEAKVAELNNGDILMSSRTSGYRLWTKSTDGGVNWGSKNSWSEIWGNACDADIVRYTSTKDGYDKDRILHTLPNASNRSNVTMWMSYDEGTTWPVKKTICPGTSAYSSITILPDGTIGVFLEEDDAVPYKMYFLNFSLNWLTDGTDTYTSAGTELVAQPVVSLASGKYGPPQTVTITTATSGASIYYTLDGSSPNKNSNLYIDAITLNNSCSLKAIAIKEGMANSTVTTTDYTLGYIIPIQYRAVGAERYLTAITTTNAGANINYAASATPASYYIYYNTEAVTSERLKSFTLNLTALPGQTDGLQWCQAIILVDWNKDYDFADTGERIAIIGNRASDNSATVMNISQNITVPENAVLDKTRIRVVYTDGWRSTTYADLGEDPVDKGRVYDLDLIIEGSTGVDNVFAEKLTISPNPTRGIVNVNLPESGKYSIQVNSLEGKTIKSQDLSITQPENVSFNLSSFQQGVYMINVKHESGLRKLIKIFKE
ncbi:MAG: exo-alpha-sialidase [Paludibacteraceae bacterium]